MIRFTSLAPQREIGASCFLLELGEARIALDSGTHPKREGSETLPRLDDLPFDSLDAIVLTHAHLDHSGALPVLVREHPSARVFMSEPTRSLADALLHNSVNVMTSKREDLGIHAYPLYTHRELERIFPAWETPAYERPFHVSAAEDVTCEFFEAGHILGAVAPLFEFRGRRFLYTGDIHTEDQTIARAARLPEGHLDTVIVETTRGGVARAADYTRDKEKHRLADAINGILDRRGAVLIPVFAMGKTQELLVMLHELKLDGVIPHAPIHIGGLGTKMTTIYDRLAARSRRNYPGFKILEEIDLIVCSSRKRATQVEFKPGCIFALSSGMMTENTVSNVFARQLLSDPRSGILFVGYADPDSPAGKILAASPGDEIRLDPRRPAHALKCQVEKFDFSGHATREDICDFLESAAPKNVVLIHGDTDAVAWFEAEMARRLPGARVIVPEPGKPYEL